MECKTNPIELVLATRDPKLYNSDEKRWRWEGKLYWLVECIHNNQKTVADIKAPFYSSKKYVAIEGNPVTWDFCGSKCNIQSHSLHVVFTFKPDSKEPKDFLQFVVDPYSKVTDKPLHFITDMGDNAIYFDISQVNKLSKKPYVELWLEFTTAEKGELIIDQGEQLNIDNAETVKQGGENYWLILIIGIIIIFISALIFYVVRD